MRKKRISIGTITLLTSITVCSILIVLIMLYPLVFTQTETYSLVLYDDNGNVESEFNNCLGITRLNTSSEIIVYLENGESFKTDLDYKLTPNSIE